MLSRVVIRRWGGSMIAKREGMNGKEKEAASI